MARRGKLSSQARVARIPLRVFTDRRGQLVVFEGGTSLPFSLRRAFVISRVAPPATRAGHVVSCDEVLVALRGKCVLRTNKEGGNARFPLCGDGSALWVRQGTWISLSKFSPGAIVLVLASKKFRSLRGR